jgi:hypothetical protein
MALSFYRLVSGLFIIISAKLAYIKDTFIAKGEHAMKSLPSLWISRHLNYLQQQMLANLELLTLMILTVWFKRWLQNSNRLIQSLIAPFWQVWLKKTGSQTTLINSYFLVTQRVSPSYNTLSFKFIQNIYFIPSDLNTS